MPADLHARLAKCIKLADVLAEGGGGGGGDSDNDAGSDSNNNLLDVDDAEAAEETARLAKLNASVHSLNPSNVTLIRDAELLYEYLELRLEPPPESRRTKTRPMHWLPHMLQQRRVDRVIWPTKIYQFDRMFSSMSLFDQAELMMDWAAGDFAAWLQSIGDPEEPSLSKDIIKQLFSIAAEGDASKALYVEPTVKKAIPDAVAKSIGMPTLSLDYNVARLLRQDEIDKLRPARRIAFGRHLDAGDARESGADGMRPLVPQFPDAMRSKRTIFEGITHLRATRALATYLEENPEIRRPPYLVEEKMFAEENWSGGAPDGRHGGQKRHVPLYKYFMND